MARDKVLERTPGVDVAREVILASCLTLEISRFIL